MTREQVICALIKDYERAIGEGWGKVELWDKSMLFGICFAASKQYDYYIGIVDFLGYVAPTPMVCKTPLQLLNSLTARLFLLHSLND